MSYLLARADARSIPLADESVQCVVTSPPYFALRDYGTATWVGGDPACEHTATRRGHGATEKQASSAGTSRDPIRGGDCRLCGARRVDQQIGLEPTPRAYVEAMLGVFAEVHRVMRDDATLWLNIGDSYNAYNGGAGPSSSEFEGRRDAARPKLSRGYGLLCKSLKPKDLIGIPWMLAFALRDELGFYLRSDIIWSKMNCMPESVEDRPTKSHEYLFLLAKSERYFYDAEAIREKCESSPSDVRKMEEQRPRIGGKHKDLVDPLSKASAATNIGRKRSVGDPSGRNRRSVWTIATQPYRGSHFAVMPRTLASCCIKAGSRPGDVVFDPFVGSGTTLVVAEALGRCGIGLDLSADYLALANRRIDRPHAPVQRVAAAEPLPLFDRGA